MTDEISLDNLSPESGRQSKKIDLGKAPDWLKSSRVIVRMEYTTTPEPGKKFEEWELPVGLELKIDTTFRSFDDERGVGYRFCHDDGWRIFRSVDLKNVYLIVDTEQ